MSCNWYSQHLNWPYQAWKGVQRGDFELLTMIIGKVTYWPNVKFDLMYKLFLNHHDWFNASFWFSTRKSGCQRSCAKKRFSIIFKRIRKVNVHYLKPSSYSIMIQFNFTSIIQDFRAYSSSEHRSGRDIRYPEASRFTKAIGDVMLGYGNSPVWRKEDMI